MVNLELSHIMRRIVEEQVGLGPDDGVLVLTDSERFDIAKALTIAARATGATVVLSVIPRTATHGADPPGIVASSLRSSDIAFVLTTHSITHTDAYREAKEGGTRISSMRGVTEDMFIEGGINTDFDEMDRLTARIKSLLNDARTVSVTAPAGTDVEFDITDRPAYLLGVGRHDLNDDIGSFPSGESPVAPAEGSTNGTIVIDHSMDGIGLLGSPIRLAVEEGYVVDITGGVEAAELRKIVKEADEQAGNIAEFAIGTNRDARLIGNVAESKKRLGTVHFAIGDNRTLNGSVRSDIHLDGVVLEPTIRLDDEVIVQDGRLVDELFE